MKRCLYCDAHLQVRASWGGIFGVEKEKLLCEKCSGKLESLAGPLCEICGRSLNDLDETYHNGTLCSDCIRWEDDVQWQGVLTKNCSVYQYNSFLKEMMAKFKYRGDYALGEAFGESLLSLYRSECRSNVLVPIPLSDERLYERGFNQADVLASMVGAPVHALKRAHHEEKQSKKTREARIRKVENPFVVVAGVREQVTSAHITIVDDIYTTGATLRYAAKALLDCGAKSVSSLTVARG
ncbi:ComF family protein [Alkalihalobacterium sp. APHAB7]|uniref:ComF family protein n=1 Tax=Alkalihalobacterium sp. APHAB7 TaxID=3402081 RepID=UPI003AB05687